MLSEYICRICGADCPNEQSLERHKSIAHSYDEGSMFDKKNGIIIESEKEDIALEFGG